MGKGVESKIKDYRTYKKVLEAFLLTSSKIKDSNRHQIKVGKKYNFIECPSGEVADMVMGSIHSVISTQIEKVTQIIDCLEAKAEQLSIDLFGSGGEANEDMKD